MKYMENNLAKCGTQPRKEHRCFKNQAVTMKPLDSTISN